MFYLLMLYDNCVVVSSVRREWYVQMKVDLNKLLSECEQTVYLHTLSHMVQRVQERLLRRHQVPHVQLHVSDRLLRLPRLGFLCASQPLALSASPV